MNATNPYAAPAILPENGPMDVDTVEAPRGRVPLSRRVLALATVLAVLVAGVTGWLLLRGDDTEATPDPTTVFVLNPLNPGEKFSLGSIYFEHTGSDLEILEVNPRMSANLDYLGAIAIWPQDSYRSALDVGNGFPAKQQKYHHPALGVVIPAAEFDKPTIGLDEPSHLLAVTAGFRIRIGDVGAVVGVELVYRAGKKVKRQYFAQAAVACVKPHPCGRSPERNGVSFHNQVFYDLGLIPRAAGSEH
ncbi:MAG: hypothetical protein ACT4QG_05705 [Sporichthyaceae bacterium]